jgi:hypothetical protein
MSSTAEITRTEPAAWRSSMAVVGEHDRFRGPMTGID